MIFLFKIESLRCRAGFLTGVFFLGYGIARIGVEFFREPDMQIGYLYGHVSMGILLSAIMILIGFLIYLKRKDETKSQKI